MNITDLPVGDSPKPLTFSHFPTRHQSVIWRNWEIVPVERLARVLGTDVKTIFQDAREMGLRVPPRVVPEWQRRGCVTIIMANWHLLPYAQLLQVLDWTPERFHRALMNEDFLWSKAGGRKPDCKAVVRRPLTADEKKRTAELRQLVKKHFPDKKNFREEPPFAFRSNLKPAGVPAGAGRNRFKSSFAYPYHIPYGEFFSEDFDLAEGGLLNCLAGCGVDGIWVPFTMHEFIPFHPVLNADPDSTVRLARLKKLTEQAARLKMGVFLYVNEPRALPRRCFLNHPEYMGTEHPYLDVVSLCTSSPAVCDYLREGFAWLFKQVPLLAGLFTITRSEYPTNCLSHNREKMCPRCIKRPPEEVISEVNRLIAEGTRSAKPDARVIAWNWSWEPAWEEKAVDLLPDGVELMCTSESGGIVSMAGVETATSDYLLSQPGPGERALRLWRRAQRRGMRTVAKIQMNNSWECAGLPWLPVPYLVEEHVNRLAGAGVDSVMASWTLGGYPGGNLELLASSPAQLADRDYGKKAAPVVKRAWYVFGSALRQFLPSLPVLYTAPQNYGPKNLLYLKPTGYRATMVGFPYDDIKAWANIYPPEVFEEQFRKLSLEWKEGLALLEKARALVPAGKKKNLSELERMALAAHCHFRSTYLQTAFVRRRTKRSAENRRQLKNILREEIELAKTLHRLVKQDSRIGFETTLNYLYTANDLKEKVLNCEYIISSLKKAGDSRKTAARRKTAADN